jgi:hypothetical protein
LKITDSTNDLEAIDRQILVDKFEWPGKMKSIGDNDPWIVLLQGDHYRLCIIQGIYLLSIYDGTQLKKAEQNLVLAL